MHSVRVMLTGKRRRGKNTMARIMEEYEPALHIVGFADALKREMREIVLERLGPRGGALAADKTLMGLGWQWWGVLRRELDPDYWIKQAEWVLNLSHVAIVDCRFLNEAAWGRKHGFVIVKIIGPAHGPLDPRSDQHPSETELELITPDLVFDNSRGLEEMREFVREILLPYAREQARMGA